jgi:hypothetical protein
MSLYLAAQERDRGEIGLMVQSRFIALNAGIRPKAADKDSSSCLFLLLHYYLFKLFSC